MTDIRREILCEVELELEVGVKVSQISKHVFYHSRPLLSAGNQLVSDILIVSSQIIRLSAIAER